MRVYGAESVELFVAGRPIREWSPTTEDRAARRLPGIEFKMSLPLEPDTTRMLIRELRRRERKRTKRARRARRVTQ